MRPACGTTRRGPAGRARIRAPNGYEAAAGLPLCASMVSTNLMGELAGAGVGVARGARITSLPYAASETPGH
jgi:hypothetical protein